jgi:cob(I)alamin adenosyltransferase
MKIYTKTGDKGTTSLYDCSRVSKSSILIDLLGDIDELNSFIGIIDSSFLLKDIQTWLFDLGTIIANPNKKYSFDISQEFTKILEKEIDMMTQQLPKLTNFILPSGNIHLSRAIARRCERKLVDVITNGDYKHIDDNCLVFINRLSDYLFTLARYECFMKGKDENIYKKSSILKVLE